MWRRNKDKSDQYIKETTYLKRHAPGIVTTRRLRLPENPHEAQYAARLHAKRGVYAQALSLAPVRLPPDGAQLPLELADDLIEGLGRLDRHNELFNEASAALGQEEVSEESFRTFNEAYKSFRTFIEAYNLVHDAMARR